MDLYIIIRAKFLQFGEGGRRLQGEGNVWHVVVELTISAPLKELSNGKVCKLQSINTLILVKNQDMEHIPLSQSVAGAGALTRSTALP